MNRDNNFDSLRLFGALLVLVGHASPLTGLWEAPEIGHIKIYRIGVLVFFSISGYLITASWLHQPNLRKFLLKRALRLFPALLITLLVTVFVIGSIFTKVPLESYLSSPQTWSYLALGALLMPQYELPGLFLTGHPLTAVNGSLWTLGLEFTCYLAIAAICLLVARKTYLGPAVWISVSALLLSPAFHLDKILATSIETAIFFAAGSLLYFVFRGNRLPHWIAPVALGSWLLADFVNPALGQTLSWLAIPMAVVAFGMQSYPGMRDAAKFGDFSYGLYLWAFPVQQVTIEVFGLVEPWLNILIVLSATLTLAVLSWHLIEKRALRLKPN